MMGNVSNFTEPTKLNKQLKQKKIQYRYEQEQRCGEVIKCCKWFLLLVKWHVVENSSNQSENSCPILKFFKIM